MSTTLVTGGSGLVGFNIGEALRRRGCTVRYLARSPEKMRRLVAENAEVVHGDVTDSASVAEAMRGCSEVYHAAGLPEQWLADPGTFDRVNVGGTHNVVEAALELGVGRFAYTSTIDVFAAPPGSEYDESTLDPEPKGTAYERSKQAADRVVVEALNRGLPAVFLHPSGVYGPGPTGSRGINHFLTDLRDGKVPMLLPGGMPVVFAADVGEGHVLAAEKGAPGSRYILSDRYLSLRELAEKAAAQLGLRKVPPVMPLWVGKLVADVGELISQRTGRPPLIPKGQLHFLQWRARPSADRAKHELGWATTPFAEGLARTLEAAAA